MMDPFLHPIPRALRIAALVYAMFLIGLAVAHGQTNPYTNPEEFMANPPVVTGPTSWMQRTSPTDPKCVLVYTSVWICPEYTSTTPTAPVSPTPATAVLMPFPGGNVSEGWNGWQSVSASGDLSPPLPQPSSRTLMFGNVVAGLDGAPQDYVPFLNLSNGWQPQAFLVTIVVGERHWQQTYDMPVWSHKSINLRDTPLIQGQTTGFAIYVQVWGVATASVSLHRAGDAWGPAFQTIQPDAIPTPQYTPQE